MVALIVIVVLVVVLAGAGFVGLRVRGPRVERADTAVTAPPKPTGREEVVESGAPQGGAPKEARADMNSGLGRTRGVLSSALFGRSRSQDEMWADLEAALIRTDMGVAVVEEIVAASRAQKPDAKDVGRVLAKEIRRQFVTDSRELNLAGGDPSVVLVVGVNGSGKTTTVGKIAGLLAGRGLKVVIAAGDTFRAAATEQVSLWAKLSDVEVVSAEPGADPASVVFDAIEHGKAVGADVVICDTAGRLQNKANLMAELGKVRRVAEKGSGTVTETLLVLDATTGQNGVSQAKVFTEAANVTGVVLTKLDGSARGGVVIGIERETRIPVKLVGLGERLDDLAEFDPDAFVDALVAREPSELGQTRGGSEIV